MANISLEQIKQLREKTGLGVMEAKSLLTEAGGDFDQALTLAQARGAAKAAKRAEREASEGYIGLYLHDTGKISAMVELLCETDFVAKNEEFQTLAKDIAMQIAALNPLYLSVADVPADVDPETFEGRTKEEVCLLSQAYLKDPSKNIEIIVQEAISKIGENIKVGKFSRFSI